MKIVNASANIVNTDNISRLHMMETAGRICYRSEDKITDVSAESFCEGVIKKKHNSVTEFAIYTFEILAPYSSRMALANKRLKYITIDGIFYIERPFLVTGTLRAFREAYTENHTDSILYDIIVTINNHTEVFTRDINIKYPTTRNSVKILSVTDVDNLPLTLQKRHRWVMVKYIVNRAVSHELVRHRPVSWLQESQRYCRYSDDKFGNEVTFIDPRKAFEYFNDSVAYRAWVDTMKYTELEYLYALNHSASPQAARTMLPNSCKTELYQLCNLEEWEIFFKLRTSLAAEPSMREVTIPLYKQFSDKFPKIFVNP